MKNLPDVSALTGENNPLTRFPQLYEAALDEFSAKSWGEASLNDIIRHSGVSKGSVYHHFGDKFGLYLALMDIIGRRKMEFFLPRLREIGEGADFFTFVKALSREMMAFMFRDPRMYTLSGRLLNEDAAFIKRLTDCFPQQKEGMLRALAEGALKSGQVDPRFSPEFVSRMLEILFSNLHLLPGVNDAGDAWNGLELALDMMQYGLCGKPPSDDSQTQTSDGRAALAGQDGIPQTKETKRE